MDEQIEITGDDVALLKDDDLRSLIGLLCEAEFRLAGMSPKGVTWGGHQDAPDGGLDVKVECPDIPKTGGFIPRKSTGFQVKKPDMPAGKINDEMRPDNVLRETIVDLINKKGAYVIVCSSGSTADKALKARQKAMLDAVADHPKKDNLHLEFMDRSQVATWVRSHPSMILWVRNRIGKSIKGWRPYGNWVSVTEDGNDEYILDERVKLFSGKKSSSNGITSEEGLNELRTVLSSPASSVRLTGLSGVGKTRFVQALFDERIGKGPLNPSQVFYTDMSYAPVPDPGTFTEQLISLRTKAILIVDNCSQELHASLTRICAAYNSKVSILTIEYDVRDHLPESTTAYRLEPASDDLIEKVIGNKFPYISQVDARRIADCSGGNARIAIAIASTMNQSETLSNLRDQELFERLFKQKNEHNENLLIAAEVLSLVYSFDGVDTRPDESELNILGRLINQTPEQLYRFIKILKERHLVQSRDKWRAVLPHAIANWLARRALDSIPKKSINDAILNSASERLIKSFSRRLGYLHDHQVAIDIVSEWLSKGGWIGKNIGNLNAFGMGILNNIAPVYPPKTLESLERASGVSSGFGNKDLSNKKDYIGLIRNLAYEDQYFERCIKLLVEFFLHEENLNEDSAVKEPVKSTIKSFFYLYLSGTHATLERRLSVLRGFINSKNEGLYELALKCLDASLTTSHFTSSHDFEFGSRPRDYGYEPKEQEEVTKWFREFLSLIVEVSVSDLPIADKAKSVLARNLRCLWCNIGLVSEIKDALQKICGQGSWGEGWIAIREIIGFDKEDFDEKSLALLHEMEKNLAPKSLCDQVMVYAFDNSCSNFALENGFLEGKDNQNSATELLNAKVFDLGAEVAGGRDVFSKILPGIFTRQGYRLPFFGKGLCDGAADRKEVWRKIYQEFAKTSDESKNIAIMDGFLTQCSQIDSKLYNKILDECVEDDVLAVWYPILQNSGHIDLQGVKRLFRSLDVGLASAHAYRYLGYGKKHESISDNDFAELLKRLAGKDERMEVPIELITMRFHGVKRSDAKISEKLRENILELLANYNFPDERRNKNNDFNLAKVSQFVLGLEGGKDAAIRLCRSFYAAETEGRIYSFDYPKILNAIAEIQPIAFLDTFLDCEPKASQRRINIFSDDKPLRASPLKCIDDAVLLKWCQSDPGLRFDLISSSIRPFRSLEKGGEAYWTPLALSIIDLAPNREVILNNYYESFFPRSYSGSKAKIMRDKLVLFDQLYTHSKPQVTDWARKNRPLFEEKIRVQQDREKEESRTRYESFE